MTMEPHSPARSTPPVPVVTGDGTCDACAALTISPLTLAVEWSSAPVYHFFIHSIGLAEVSTSELCLVSVWYHQVFLQCSFWHINVSVYLVYCPCINGYRFHFLIISSRLSFSLVQSCLKKLSAIWRCYRFIAKTWYQCSLFINSQLH